MEADKEEEAPLIPSPALRVRIPLRAHILYGKFILFAVNLVELIKEKYKKKTSASDPF